MLVPNANVSMIEMSSPFGTIMRPETWLFTRQNSSSSCLPPVARWLNPEANSNPAKHSEEYGYSRPARRELCPLCLVYDAVGLPDSQPHQACHSPRYTCWF